MNQDELTRIVTDALREAWRQNVWHTMPYGERAVVETVLEDFAIALTNEVWPDKSAEAPYMPEEWAAAIKEP